MVQVPPSPEQRVLRGSSTAPGRLLARPGTAEQGAAMGCTIFVLSFTYCHKIGLPSSAEVIVVIF